MNTPWAVILCKFADGDDEPFPLQYYRDLFTADDTGSAWNMPRYFSDWSHGQLDLSGTNVFGWYKLQQSVADYNAITGDARDALIGWACAAAVADGVDLTPYFSTVVCTNLWQDIGAANGVVCQGPTTATPSLLGHEMGHVYGLSHSRIDGSDTDYLDPWDIMSAANDFEVPEPEFKYIGPGLNAWNMRSRGWLDETRVWKNAADTIDETISLRPLVRRDLEGYLAAELPGGYLAEFRVVDGWDQSIPRAAVLIHRFDGGHSYLMRGNSAKSDLVAGDSFGDGVPSPFYAFERLDVISIDEVAQVATLRIQHRPASKEIPRAVDPLSLILSGPEYVVWSEWHHPHVPKISEVREIVRTMTFAEQSAALARARTMTAYAKVVEKALSAPLRFSGILTFWR